MNKDNEHALYLKKLKIEKISVTCLRIGILVSIFGLWELAAILGWIDPFIFSSPSRIIKSLVKIYSEGTLFTHIWITCYETIVGFILGTVLGTLVAILLWWSGFLSKVLDPYLVVLNALPKIALAPIIIFWFGNNTTSIIVIALLISIVVTIISVLAGFNEVDKDKITLMKTFGASKLQILNMLIIPASVPTLISALKINVGLSWVGVIIGEFQVAKEGLGFLIIYGGQVAQLDMVMMSIIILSIIAYLMYVVVAFFENKIKNKY